jgi:uncharacterized phage-associated protein
MSAHDQDGTTSPAPPRTFEERDEEMRKGWSPEIQAYAATLATRLDLERRLREARTVLRLTPMQIGAITGETPDDLRRIEAGEMDLAVARMNQILDHLRTYVEAVVAVVEAPWQPLAAQVAAAYLCCIHSDEGVFNNLKLQILLYYAQGYALAHLGQPLFVEPIEAWGTGPVVTAIWDAYQTYGDRTLPRPDDFDPFSVAPAGRMILERVYVDYGSLADWQLLQQVMRQESPWRDTPRDTVIPLDRLRAHFIRQLNEGNLGVS